MISDFTNKSLNDNLINDLDETFVDLVKDADKNIRYIKVLTQEEYNQENYSNDTLYFINNISEELINISNILDIAVSHTSTESNQPEKLWVLTVDTEMCEVDLWVSGVKSGTFKLKKVFKGYKDGCLTFDGEFKFLISSDNPDFITKEEPFVFLIKENGELYAFPSLKYKTESINHPAIRLVGGDGEIVTFCSADKGYCSDLIRGDDQGIIIAYSKIENNSYHLCYRQYGYGTDDSTVKVWSDESTIAIADLKDILTISVRRLSDYRVGLTCNYRSTNDTIKTIFFYSAKNYGGIAYHPEFLELEEDIAAGPLMYGAVRNDNIDEIEIPYLSLSEDFSNLKEKRPILAFELYTANTYNKKKVKLQLLNPNSPEGIEHGDLSAIINVLTLENEYPYSDYNLGNDPIDEFNGAQAKASFVDAYTENNKIIIVLDGDHLPATPFRLVPTSNAINEINIRYLGKDFPNTNISGWFSFTDLLRSEWIGIARSVGVGPGMHDYFGYSLSTAVSLTVSSRIAHTSTQSANFSTINVNISYYSQQEYICCAATEIYEEAEFSPSITIGTPSCNFSMVCYGGSTIHV